MPLVLRASPLRPPLLHRATWLALLLAWAPACGPTDPDPGDDDDSTSAADDDDGSPAVLTLPTTVEVLVTRDGQPLAGATVLQGGTEDTVLSDAEGRASLELVEIPGGEVWVIAALEGHRSIGEELFREPEAPVELELVPIQVDNPDYEYGLAGVEDRQTTEYCSHCHITITEQFGGSAHYESARDEQVHDLYAGTAAALQSEAACVQAGGIWRSGTLPGGAGPGERCYLGWGLLPDSSEDCGGVEQQACDDPTLPAELVPTATGACADCHAPAVGGALGGGHSLLGVEGLAYAEGITCDFCHKVGGIDLDAPAGVGGRTVLGRPLEVADGFVSQFRPVMYGPYRDVLNPYMGGAYSPIFENGQLCAGCHELEQEPLWDDPALQPDPARWPEGRLPIHSTWSEWSGSIHSPKSPCRTCHMPAAEQANSADIELLDLEPGVAAGFIRPDGAVRDHGFYGPLDERPGLGRLLDTAAALGGSASVDGSELVVEVSVTNVLAGHGLPTGEPLRSMVLLVQASCGDSVLQAADGPRLSALSGALAQGELGSDVAADPDSIAWDDLQGVPLDEPLRVHVLRPTGSFLDYSGVGPFGSGDGSFAPEAKGLPELEHLGSVEATQTAPGILSIAEPLPGLEGDLLLLAEPLDAPVEGGEAGMLAGQPGMDFGRVLADAQGRWPVPHHRAVDVLRDNRLLPYGSDARTWRFTLPDGCDSPSASATLLYRAYPPALARERSWPSLDHVMGSLELAPD